MQKYQMLFMCHTWGGGLEREMPWFRGKCHASFFLAFGQWGFL